MTKYNAWCIIIFMDRDTVYFYIPERKYVKYCGRNFYEFYFTYIDDVSVELILYADELVDIISVDSLNSLTSLSK